MSQQSPGGVNISPGGGDSVPVLIGNYERVYFPRTGLQGSLWMVPEPQLRALPLRWEILIPTIPHRHGKLCQLLDVLGPQLAGRQDVRVVAWRDNLGNSYRAKLQGLYDMATADYVSSLSDDDSVAPDFIERCLAAMETGAAQIGFWVRYTEDGIPQHPVLHSLRHEGWYGAPSTGLFRDHMYYNPVARELAREVRFRGDFCDEEWAEDVRKLGHVRTEEFIDAEMLYYQRTTADNFHTPREPMPLAGIPLRPQRPWLSWLEPGC